MERCLKCNGDNVVKGKIDYPRGVAVFSPEKQRLFSISLVGGARIIGEAFACLDCGFVWGSTSPDELRDFIQKHCTQKNKQSDSIIE